MYRVLSLSVALGFGLLAAVSANAADKVTWNFSLYGPPRAATVTFEHLAKVAKEKSGGNFIINLKYNEQLGLMRAEAVKRYLYEKHQVPLHKINVISYGEGKPVAPNKTRDGRAQNRRVVIKVLA